MFIYYFTDVLFEPEDESEYNSINLIFVFLFPITLFSSLIIILSSICCLEFPICKTVIYVLLFIFKGCVIFRLLWYFHNKHFDKKIICDILIGGTFIILCLFSFSYQIQLIMLKIYL